MPSTRLTVVTPVYNEEAVLPHFHERTRAVLDSLPDVDGDPSIFVYAPSSEATAPIAAAVRRATASAKVEPLSVRVDQWLPEEMRWSSDRRRREGVGSDWDVADVIMGIFTGPWPSDPR